MNRTFLFIFTLITLPYIASANTQANYQSFVPKNWKIIFKAKGDLNGDHQTDLALIIENTNPKNIHKNDSLGDSELNQNLVNY